ncbi:uncharacterized protein LOC144175457 [Haemaphysalis longicornis]
MSCRGKLICRPNPYGCSCGTGFYGPFCNETCPPHKYGADCKQSRICSCKAEPFCDVHTGVCVRDQGLCREGWTNAPFCDTMDSRYNHPVDGVIIGVPLVVIVIIGVGSLIYFCICKKEAVDHGFNTAIRKTLRKDLPKLFKCAPIFIQAVPQEYCGMKKSREIISAE